MGFKTEDTIMLILAVNVTAAIGAFGFGYAQDRLGKVRALRVTIVRLVRDGSVLAYLGADPGHVLGRGEPRGALHGIEPVGGARTRGLPFPARAQRRVLRPVGLRDAARGDPRPAHYGAVTWATGGNHRLAILLTSVFFIAALAILAFVNERRGRAQVE